ncbi:hypothetical protein [Pseudonocardia acaciae]|nr:hypothetical protein [Pseudonocardia acaciae]
MRIPPQRFAPLAGRTATIMRLVAALAVALVVGCPLLLWGLPA